MTATGPERDHLLLESEAEKADLRATWKHPPCLATPDQKCAPVQTCTVRFATKMST